MTQRVSEVNDDTCGFFWLRALLSRFELCEGGLYNTPDRCNPPIGEDWFCPKCPFGRPNVSEIRSTCGQL